ncbi:hypothetical protein RhiJN_20307 [Ceratobasidium sp. AG-Ba]|nr:hypothetical protein RhiJN_20307 [Ceratobasidium sp. AG-Ba]
MCENAHINSATACGTLPLPGPPVACSTRTLSALGSPTSPGSQTPLVGISDRIAGNTALSSAGSVQSAGSTLANLHGNYSIGLRVDAFISGNERIGSEYDLGSRSEFSSPSLDLGLKLWPEGLLDPQFCLSAADLRIQMMKRPSHAPMDWFYDTGVYSTHSPDRQTYWANLLADDNLQPPPPLSHNPDELVDDGDPGGPQFGLRVRVNLEMGPNLNPSLNVSASLEPDLDPNLCHSNERLTWKTVLTKRMTPKINSAIAFFK